jgi:hypothetical protein
MVEEMTFCKCKKSQGYYEKNGLDSVYSGAAIPIGIGNESFVAAISKDRQGDRPDGLGHRFTAFVLPKSARTVTMKSRTSWGIREVTYTQGNPLKGVSLSWLPRSP